MRIFSINWKFSLTESTEVKRRVRRRNGNFSYLRVLCELCVANRRFDVRSILFCVFFISTLSSCSGLEKFEKRNLNIDTGGGPVSIRAEIASTPAQREQGLMYRKRIKDGEAMLFVFERDEMLSFWMKNTIVPLSIAYISHDGRILEIYDMEPGNLNPVRSSRSVRYALEVPQGWFGRAGIGIGDRLNLNFNL